MKNILVIGSGGLRVGQAGEFDYSGSQAIKAFKSDGYKVILINPNIATVQTDNSMADKTYFSPLNIQEVEKIIKAENIQLLALGFGGQTALNLGLELYNSGILTKYKVEVLGSSIKSIEATENREIFRDTLNTHNIKTPISQPAESVDEAIIHAKEIGYPLMMRSAFSLGGLGSGKINNEEELITKVSQVLSVTSQVLLEEYLTGWKEFEYEIVRDMKGNSLTICSMENLDPMGIHTGESIVVAPAQTLNDHEHQLLRDISLKCAAIFEIIGECNIQFAINPSNGDYRVIEMNPRLSRSSALASKATGYPLAYIAAKLCLGYALHELTNNVTKQTSAFFEPALDYVVVKFPRWDTHKLREATRNIGTEMKSVGEVMGIGRSFPESLQKAIQMLNIGASGLDDYPWPIADLASEIEFATDRRIFALYQWFKQGHSITQAHQLSNIDNWFLSQIKEIADYAKFLIEAPLEPANLLKAKQYGFSDLNISKIKGCHEDDIRKLRLSHKIIPRIKQIDTVAGEFSAATNYLYLTYHGKYNDIVAINSGICILGSGPYSIGSSVEFDWCTVNLARIIRKYGQSVIIINSNPETVSTDYDESDRLYFEPLTLERVADILDFEKVTGVALSVGGQIANNLAMPLYNMQYQIIGTSPLKIHNAEDRKLFSQLLTHNNIDQPRWISATSVDQIHSFTDVVGFPVIIRPSYVLSGAAMKVATNAENLDDYLEHALKISKEHAVVVSEFIDKAIEVDVDGVANNGLLITYAISEHVENAGVHSGDATLIFPQQNLSTESTQKIKQITSQIAKELDINGPFNMQLLIKDGQVKVIECNIRASRSFPFISKVSGCNLIELVAKAILNQHLEPLGELKPSVIGIKSPVFSYNRFKGSDPVAQIEMSSTGEVACMGDNLLNAFYQSWIATGQTIKGKRILLTAPNDAINELNNELSTLLKHGFTITTNSKFNQNKKIPLNYIENVDTLIRSHQIDLMINIPHNIYSSHLDLAEFKNRRLAIDYHIPLITNLNVAKLLLASLAKHY